MVARSQIPYGHCHCGCGRATKVAHRTDRTRGWVRGEPIRYVNGHATAKSGAHYRLEDCGFGSPCWVWQRTKTSHGYGRMWDGNQMAPAHRVYYEQAKGPVPEGLWVDHLCRNPACVNPDHLEAVTPSENQRRGNNAKLTPEDVAAIRASNETQVALGERYGVHNSTISAIQRGKKWRD